MALDPITLGILLKGASQGIKTGSRLMQPKFGNTAYGRQLKQVKRDGALSKGQETGIIGNVSRTASRQSAVANKRYMGGLINRGMQGSVSAQRGLREAEADVRRTVADTGREMFQNEERAKSDAKMQYARGLDQDKAQRRQAEVGMLTAGLDTLSSLQGAKTQRADKLALEKQESDASKTKSYVDAVAKYGLGNTRNYVTPTGETRTTGGLDPNSPGGRMKSIEQLEADAKSIDGSTKSALEYLGKAETDEDHAERLKLLQKLYPQLFK